MRCKRMRNYAGSRFGHGPIGVVNGVFTPASLPGIGIWLDPNAGSLFSDQAGTTPVTANGSIVRDIAGVNGLGSASGNPTDAIAAIIDTASYPGNRSIYLPATASTALFDTFTGLVGAQNSFTLAIDYVPISRTGSHSPGTMQSGACGIYETSGTNNLAQYLARDDFSSISSVGVGGIARRRLIVRYGASNRKFKIDGVDYTLASAPPGSASLTGATLGNDGPLANPMQLVLAEYILCSGAISDALASQLDNYFLTKRPTAVACPTSVPLVVCDGDSITGGFTIANCNSWTYRTEASIGHTKCRMINTGQIAQPLIGGIIPSAATFVDPFYSASRSKNICCILGGTNDLIYGIFGSAATLFAAIKQYCQARHTAGLTVALQTIPPSTLITGATETARVAVNNLLLADSTVSQGTALWSGASYCDVLVNWQIDTGLSDPSGTGYTDGTHPSILGHGIIGTSYMKPALAFLGVS
jgi:hypothetical protein